MAITDEEGYDCSCVTEASLTWVRRICYPNSRILEVFAVYEATKTFDFVAFFSCCDLLRF
jgi:hypothetical protein